MTTHDTPSRRELFLINVYLWLLRVIAGAGIVMGIGRLWTFGDTASWWFIGGGISLLCLPTIDSLKEQFRSWMIRKITEMMIVGRK